MDIDALDYDELLETDGGFGVYPTDTALDLITGFAGTPKQLFELVKRLWYMPEYVTVSTEPDDGEYVITLVTAGWSGNESIVAALEAGWTVMSQFWYSSARGGRHEYRVLAERWELPLLLAGTLTQIAGRASREHAMREISKLRESADISDLVYTRVEELVNDVVTSPLPVTVSGTEGNGVQLLWSVEELDAVVTVHEHMYTWQVILPDGISTGQGRLFPSESFREWLRVLQRVSWDRKNG